ncbi:MAG: penicillin acylase family protein [Planctomycetales bacterium]|nr:penicillin acylase family protein [Planctomycetales bacterium]
MDRIATKFARREFEAVRDENGVPHVRAASWLEALYALGYLHALDRPTQLLFGRVVASGTASQRIVDTPELRETDRFFRRAGLYRHLQREISLLDDDIFRQLTVYCEGVNDGMKQAGRSLPMWATGFKPLPWNQQAVMLIGNLLSFGGLAIGQQQNERLLIELIQLGVEQERMLELLAPMVTPDEVDFELIRQLHVSSQLSDKALELITDLPTVFGSNAWAVSPQRSATGHALLASDPHLEVNRLPAIWYEAVLAWDEHYVMGATLPGCPLFGVGRTERLAWGVTYMKGDTSDYFIEDCRPGGAVGWQYRRGGEWLDFHLREEVIEHKGRDSETLCVYENEQGTLDGDPDAQGPGYYLSACWTGTREGAGRSIGTWLEVIASPSAAAAMDAVRECPQPSLVWVFADRDGHIGKQACGRFPRRGGGHAGLLPIPAWDQANHWQGWIPQDKLPREYDPPAGFIASANELINPESGPRLITLFLPDYRKRRIVERLGELPQATVEAMQQLQYDVISTHARDMLAVFMPHLPDGAVKEALANWNYSYDPASVEATLFQRLYLNVLLEVFGHEKGIGWRRMIYLCSRVGYSTMILTCIDRLLKQPDSLWRQNRDKGELIRRAASRLEGSEHAPWAETNKFHFVNRFFERNRAGHVLGFHTAEMAMPGCHATPFQGHLLHTATRESSFAPSYHFVADLGVEEAWTNLPGGPSESRFSKFYKNDITRWIAGDYKRLMPRLD